VPLLGHQTIQTVNKLPIVAVIIVPIVIPVIVILSRR